MTTKTYQGYNKPNKKADQWTIINEYKSIQEQKAKVYQKYLEQSKKKTLSQQLDRQIKERQIRQFAEKEADKYYKSIVIKNTEHAKDQQEKKKRQHAETMKKNQQQNKEQFRGIVYQSTMSSLPRKLATSIDIGEMDNYLKERKSAQKLVMMDQLDRQIQEKQREKHFSKQQEFERDQKNYVFLENRSEHRDKELHRITYAQNPYIFEEYQKIYEHKLQKQKHFQINQVQEASKRKSQNEMQKIHEKNNNLKYQNENMKRILDEQIKIKQRQKREEETVNPEELTYGTIGRMLMETKKPSNKQLYFEELQRQIQQKQKRLQEDKYMSEQEYRINLNHLNRAFQGKFANNRYIDRSIHALSDSHKVNVSMIDAQITPKPEAEAIKRRIEQIKLKRGERNSMSYSDNKVNNF